MLSPKVREEFERLLVFNMKRSNPKCFAHRWVLFWGIPQDKGRHTDKS